MREHGAWPSSIFKRRHNEACVTLALDLIPCFDSRWQAGRLFCCLTYSFLKFCFYLNFFPLTSWRIWYAFVLLLFGVLWSWRTSGSTRLRGEGGSNTRALADNRIVLLIERKRQVKVICWLNYILQIYNTSLLDKYLQSQQLCLLTHLLLCLTTCFGPTGHHQAITNKHSVHISKKTSSVKCNKL
jgi:hypothetical protein